VSPSPESRHGSKKSKDNRSPSSDHLSLSSTDSDADRKQNSVKSKYQSVNTSNGPASERFADQSLVDEDVVNIGHST
jgi:hypothetical protein